MKKSLVILTTIVVFIGLIIGFFVVSHKSSSDVKLISIENLNNTNVSNTICKTLSCFIATSRLYQRLNVNVNPCDNFYNFACGIFVEKKGIHDRNKASSILETLKNDIIEEVRRIVVSNVTKNDIDPFIVVKKFYQKCIDRPEIEELNSEPLLKVMKQLGGMPILTPNWNESAFKWEKTANEMVDVGFVTDYLVEMSIDVDPRNISKNIIWIHQPYMNFDYNLYYYDSLQQGLGNIEIKAYYDYMLELTGLLGADKSTNRDEMKDVLDFETSINIISESYQNLQAGSAYQYTTIMELQKTYPFMDWLQFARTRVPKETVVNENEEILYLGTDYIQKFSELIAKTSNETIANYMFWRIADYSVDFLSKPIRLVKLKFHQKLLGTKTLNEGWKTCITGAVESLKHAVGAMYIQQNPEYNDKKGATNIVQSTIESVKEMAKQSTWMNEEEMLAVNKILHNITSIIGLPEEYLDNNWLTKYYESIVISNDTNYYDTNLILNKFRLLTDYNILRRSVQDTQWEKIDDVTVVKTLFITTNSFLSIPTAFLRTPFYSQFLQQYFNFLVLGVDVGYSLIYSLSNKLISMDSQGFRNKSQCLVKQYENYIKKVQKTTVVGKEKSRKLLSENVSFKISYNAYKNWQLQHKDQVKSLPGIDYTSEQLFWIASAQIFCNNDRPEEILRKTTVTDNTLDQFRVISSMQNIPEFSQDFNCPLGKFMNPVEKCELF